MDVLKRLLSSRKFLAALTSAVVTVVITVVPALEGLEEHLTEIVAGFLLYIVGTAWEDAKAKGAGKHYAQAAKK